MNRLTNAMNKQKFKDFLFTPDDIILFTHRTNTLNACNNIIESGFIFTESFNKTTDRMLNDEVYLNYWNIQRKYYGDFVVLIGFSKDLINRIQIKLIEEKNHHEVQQVLSRNLDEQSEDDEHKYLLPLFYVKGFYDLKTNRAFDNVFYDPSFIPENIKQWMTE